MQEVQKSSTHQKRSSNLNLSIITYLKQGYPVSHVDGNGIEKNSICSFLKRSKSNLSYYVSSLVKSGHIIKKGYGVYEVIKDYDPEIDKKKFKQVQKSSRVAINKVGTFGILKEDDVRGHAFVVTFRIKRKLANWHNRGNVLEKHFKDLKPYPLKGGWGVVYKGNKIHLWDKSIVIYEKSSFISEQAALSRSMAIYHFLSIIKGLERMLKADFKYKKGYSFKVSREHYSLVKNCLARQYDEDNKKLEIYNDNGLWLLIDNSYNLHETETVKVNDAVNDNEGIQRYLNEHKELGWTMTPSFVLQAINDVTSNQKVFDSNMKSHLKVLNKLGDAVDELRKEIKNGGGNNA